MRKDETHKDEMHKDKIHKIEIHSSTIDFKLTSRHPIKQNKQYNSPTLLPILPDFPYLHIVTIAGQYGYQLKSLTDKTRFVYFTSTTPTPSLTLPLNLDIVTITRKENAIVSIYVM